MKLADKMSAKKKIKISEYYCWQDEKIKHKISGLGGASLLTPQCLLWQAMLCGEKGREKS